jgi:hypothetical protein
MYDPEFSWQVHPLNMAGAGSFFSMQRKVL